MSNSFYPDLRKHQLDALAALVEVDRILKRNNIRYFLLAGSTLGAVRHKGFIPWDDDIDIGIKYKDKKKAFKALKNELPKVYSWADWNTIRNFPRLYGKVLFNNVGLIDVFIIVKTSDNLISRKKQWILRKVLFKIYKGKIKYSNSNENQNIYSKLKVKAGRFFSFFISMKKIRELIEKNESRFENQNTKNYLNIYSAYSLEKELIKREWLKGNHKESFEGHLFPTVSDPDKYLKHLYGDYMTIPKKKERYQRHEERF